MNSPAWPATTSAWRPGDGIPHRLLFEDGVAVGPERINQLLKEWVSHGRLFIDFRAEHTPDDLGRMLSYSDAVLWCVRPADVEVALRTLKAVEPSVPRLREKINLVWVLDHGTPAPPHVPELHEFAARDFKTYSGEARPNQGGVLRQGVERIVHHLRGVRIGLGVSGAVRGMAHLGVLKALEEHGIYVDMLAGTSAWGDGQRRLRLGARSRIRHRLLQEGSATPLVPPASPGRRVLVSALQVSPPSIRARCCASIWTTSGWNSWSSPS